MTGMSENGTNISSFDDIIEEHLQMGKDYILLILYKNKISNIDEFLDTI